MAEVAKIPVTVIEPGGAMPSPGPGVAVLRLASGHDHAGGAPCPACVAQTDIRARLADLLEEARQGIRPPFRAVLVDARAADAERAVAALKGRLPAQALRDHMVARRFALAGWDGLAERIMTMDEAVRPRRPRPAEPQGT